MLSRRTAEPVVLLITVLLGAWLVSLIVPYACAACLPGMSVHDFEAVRLMVFLLSIVVGGGKKAFPVTLVILAALWLLRGSYVSARFWREVVQGISWLALLYWLLALGAGLVLGFRFRMTAQAS
jgi:hypothetical protein